MEDLLAKGGGLQKAMPVLMKLAAARQGDRYLHWDELRHRTPAQGFSLTNRMAGAQRPSRKEATVWIRRPPVR